MAVFLIALPDPNSDLEVKIAQTFPAIRHLKISDTLFLVKPDVSSAHAIQDQLGISLEEVAPNGLVVEISRENTTGVLPRPAVRWFKEALGKDES